LVGQPDALVQPDWFATFLGELDGIPADRRKAVLLAVVHSRPTNFRALMELANQLPINQPDGAGEREAWYRVALAVRPANTVAWIGLGGALSDQGRTDEAVECFQAALRIDPTLARAHNGIGFAFHRKGEQDEAVKAYREAIRLNPRNPIPYSNLGWELRLMGDLDGAVGAYRRAIEADPSYAPAHSNLAMTLAQMGDQLGALAPAREACRLFEEMLRRDPEHARAHTWLAWLLAVGPDGARDGPRALKHAIRACELTDWKNPFFIDTLAAAYAEVGEFDKAVEYQRLALSLPVVGKPTAEAYRSRLALYTRKVPYREALRRPVAPPPREVKR
jgi:tetratricopeptide (TPR) repeat protein